MRIHPFSFLGQSSAPAFDPLDLSPTQFGKPGNYVDTPGNGTWTAASGSDVTGAGSPGPAASGGNPTIDPATYYHLANAVQLSSWGGAGNKHVFAVAQLTSITSTAATVYSRPALVADGGQYCGLHVHKTTGPTAYWLTYYEDDGATRTATVEITSLLDGSGGGLLVAEGRKVGGNLEVRANGGSWTTGDACGSTSVTTGALNIIGANTGYAGVMKSYGTWNSALSNADADDLATWGLGL